MAPSLTVVLIELDAHTFVADLRGQEGSVKQMAAAIRKAANKRFWGSSNVSAKMTHVFHVPTVGEFLFVASNRALSHEQSRQRATTYLEQHGPKPPR